MEAFQIFYGFLSALVVGDPEATDLFAQVLYHLFLLGLQVLVRSTFQYPVDQRFLCFDELIIAVVNVLHLGFTQIVRLDLLFESKLAWLEGELLKLLLNTLLLDDFNNEAEAPRLAELLQFLGGVYIAAAKR